MEGNLEINLELMVFALCSTLYNDLNRKSMSEELNRITTFKRLTPDLIQKGALSGFFLKVRQLNLELDQLLKETSQIE